MSISEAIKGARAELALMDSPIDKIKRIATYSSIIASEIVGTLSMIPYGVRSIMLYNSLPKRTLLDPQKNTISIANIRYGPHTRNTMDIYIPPDDHSSTSTHQAKKNKKKVVLFVHGGVWAQGEKWHYSPFATRLSQAGIITAVIEYSLYPAVHVNHMVTEVNQAMTWIFENIHTIDGDVDEISLVGHSAGAHLATLALLHRSMAGFTGLESDDMNLASRFHANRSRMPKRCIGIAGCYDIGMHYEYERTRDVHELSTMARAMGGKSKFEECSPAVILQRCAACCSDNDNTTTSAVNRSGNSIGDRGVCNAPATLHGDITARQLASNRQSFSDFISRHKQSTTLTTAITTSTGNSRNSDSNSAIAVDNSAIESERACSILHTFTQTHASRLPPIILQSSTRDITVPWQESADMHLILRECRVPTRNLVYNDMTHGDFVVGWKPLGRASFDKHCAARDLKGFCKDLVDTLLSE